jgi:hypothetical protein
LRTVLMPLSLTNATTSAFLFSPFLKVTHRPGRRLASRRDDSDAAILVDLETRDAQTRRPRAFDSSDNV